MKPVKVVALEPPPKKCVPRVIPGGWFSNQRPAGRSVRDV